MRMIKLPIYYKTIHAQNLNFMYFPSFNHTDNNILWISTDIFVFASKINDF